MKLKQITILSGIFLALILLTILLEGPLKDRKKAEPKMLFEDFDPSIVEAIEIHQNEKTARLEKDGDRWVVLEVDTLKSDKSAESAVILRHLADTSSINRALVAVDSLKGEIVSKNPEKQSLFEVTSESGVVVKTYGSNDSLLAHFYIGKTGQDFSTSYIRKEGSNEVILAKGFFRGSTFHPDINRWRNRKIISFLPQNLNRLEFSSEDGNLLVQKDEGGKWIISEPIQAKADSMKVEQMLRLLSNLTSQDFGDRATPEETGFAIPTLQITMEFLDQPPRTLTVGGTKGENNYYVQASGDETVYIINKSTVQQLNKKPEDLKAVEEKKIQ